MRCIVVAPGATEVGDHHRAALVDARLVIAVDGGLGFALRAGLTVDAVIGDMDSVAEADLARATADGTTILRHRTDKDQTDLHLALDLASDRGATVVEVLGGFGGRWDHTIANALLPTAPRYRHIRIRAISDTWCAEWLNGPGSTILDARRGDTVSLVPMSALASDIWTDGLVYRLTGEDLAAGATRGVSNTAASPEPEVRIAGGTLLCITLHEKEEVQ